MPNLWPLGDNIVIKTYVKQMNNYMSICRVALEKIHAIYICEEKAMILQLTAAFGNFTHTTLSTDRQIQFRYTHNTLSTDRQIQFCYTRNTLSTDRQIQFRYTRNTLSTDRQIQFRYTRNTLSTDRQIQFLSRVGPPRHCQLSLGAE